MNNKIVIDKIPNSQGKSFALEMVEVPAGSFIMGNEVWIYTQPVHEVVFERDFYIGKYPVTQALWKLIMGENNNPSRFKGDSRPVESVSWKDAQEFIKKLNELVINSGHKYKLTSESEWEYAARGGEEGAKEKLLYAGSNRFKEVGWSNKNSTGETKPVGLKMPNQLGIYDMSGNVWEWCEDTAKENYFKYPKDGSPFHEEGNDFRMVRGGSWEDLDYDCSVFGRIRFNQVVRDNLLGFRLVRY